MAGGGGSPFTNAEGQVGGTRGGYAYGGSNQYAPDQEHGDASSGGAYGGGGGSQSPAIKGGFGAVRICYITPATGARSFPSTNVGEI